MFGSKSCGCAVTAQEKKFRKFTEPVQRAAERTFRSMKVRDASVEIFLIGSQAMRALNRRFRGKDKGTTVLSFKEPLDKSHLGEVYLAPDYIEKRREDIAYLAIHGVLHLLGYTHEEKHDRMKMEGLEQKIFSGFREKKNRPAAQ